MPEDEIRVDNVSMAVGRIGVAAILVPLLWAVALFSIFSAATGRAVAFGTALLGLGALLAWIAVRTPLWIAFTADTFVVRDLLGTHTCDTDAVAGVQIEQMFSTIGGLGTRRYPCLSIILKRGRTIRVKADPRIAALVRARLAQPNPASRSRP